SINKNDMPLLGHTFLSSAYFMVDQDRQQFTLAEAIPTEDQKLVPIGPPSCALPTPVSPPATSSASGLRTSSETTPNSSSPTRSAAQDRHTSSGAVAGAVIGGVAGLSLCVVAIILLLRRRRARQQAVEAKQYGDAKRDTKNTDIIDTLPTHKQEMAADHTHQPPAELPLQQHTSYQLEPYEMSATPALS
ncbi:MAG: hypothetical protein Q9191_008531, partial [Dirinaria sp. TL-2023a]